MNPSRPFQRVARICAWLSYGGAVLSLLAAGYRAITLGTDDAVFASLLASVVFFLGSGLVLQVMGSVDLPDLKIGTKTDVHDQSRR